MIYRDYQFDCQHLSPMRDIYYLTFRSTSMLISPTLIFMLFDNLIFGESILDIINFKYKKSKSSHIESNKLLAKSSK